MSVKFNCSSCDKEIKVPDEWYNKHQGKMGRCPYCKNTTPISVPKPEAISEPIMEPKPVLEPKPSDIIYDDLEEQGLKPCPFCAEVIKIEAKKCMHCGEIIDRSLAIAKKREHLADLRRRREIYSGKKEAKNAKASMICGIIGFFVCGIILGVIALILGLQAKTEIRKNPRLQGGRMATAGIVLGIIDIIGWIIVIAYFRS